MKCSTVKTLILIARMKRIARITRVIPVPGGMGEIVKWEKARHAMKKTILVNDQENEIVICEDGMTCSVKCKHGGLGGKCWLFKKRRIRLSVNSRPERLPECLDAEAQNA